MSAGHIGVTMGDPAGIGPEVALKACAALAAEPIAVSLVGDADYLAAVADDLGLPLTNPVLARTAVEKGVTPGRPRPADGRAALDCVIAAADMANDGDLAALVTGPLSKSVVASVAPGFLGHTEFLAARIGVADPLMVFGGIRPAVALLTTHVPLATAITAVRRPLIVSALTRLDSGWKRWFGDAPKIGVAGLNPHAGESGLLGNEEVAEIVPAIAEAGSAGIDVRGPFAADSVFRNREIDIVLALYHDQGTIMAKRAPTPSVNITLGLPYPRTSPDHGVAYDIAGHDLADEKPMVAAIRMAAAMARNR